MKILQLVQKPQLRGAEMFASQLSTHIVAAGHEAILVFVFPGEAALPFSGKTYRLNGNSSKRFFDKAAWKKLADIIVAEQPDIIQVNAGDTLKYAVSSKLMFRWKQPIVFRNASTISLYIKSLPAKLLNGFFFRYADLVASVSETSASDFAKLFPQYKNKIITIPIGIEEPNLDAILKPGPAAGRPLKIIHVGGFSFEKNHRGLISIFERLLHNGQKATLEMVGNGPLKKETEELVKQKGLSDKVTFHGFRNNAMDFIRQADVLVLPSIIEGLPGVILEAFYCRTPVVANNVGGIGEIVINGETGFLVEKNDEEGFARSIRLAADSQQSTMVSKAYNLVTTSYLNKKVADNFIAAYGRLLASSK